MRFELSEEQRVPRGHDAKLPRQGATAYRPAGMDAQCRRRRTTVSGGTRAQASAGRASSPRSPATTTVRCPGHRSSTPRSSARSPAERWRRRRCRDASVAVRALGDAAPRRRPDLARPARRQPYRRVCARRTRRDMEPRHDRNRRAARRRRPHRDRQQDQRARRRHRRRLRRGMSGRRQRRSGPGT